MAFIIRFSILTTITAITLFTASEKWARYNVWLMIAFVIVAGLIFIA